MKPITSVSKKLESQQALHKVQNGNVKKVSKLSPAVCKKNVQLKKAKVQNYDVSTYITKRRVKNPLPRMLENCSFETVQVWSSDDDFEPKVSLKQCSINSIDYKIPKSDLNDVKVESAELTAKSSSSVESDLDEKVKFVEQKVGQYNSYEVSGGCIILLYAKSTIFIHGFMQLNILCGAVDILGKYLDKTSAPSMVYSPKGCAFLSMSNRNQQEKEDNYKNQLKNYLLKVGLEDSRVNDILLYKLKTTTVVLHCCNITDKTTMFLEENLVPRIYPPLHNGLRCQFKNVTSLDWNTIQVSAEWEQLTNLFGMDKQPIRLFLCGGKSVGKSTLLRYLVNQILNEQDVVYVLDLDVGQPEFTVPGAISIVKVTSALLGPNYTHLQEPELSLCVPKINVNNDYESYIECVRKITERLPSNAPILVNYMGFTRNLGTLLTAMVLTILQPDAVLQIESDNMRRNFDVDLTPENVQEQLASQEVVALRQRYKFIKIASATNSNGKDSVGWELEPRQVREMCILAYISRVLPPHCNYLTQKDVRINQICLADVNILFNDKPCDPRAANANIVTLCADDRSTCLGWGIVRGICTKRNLLLLITPLDEERLDAVGNLIVSSVTLPSSIILRHHAAITGLAPYTYQGDPCNFARTPKRPFFGKKSQRA